MQNGGARLRMAGKHAATAGSDKVHMPVDKSELDTAVEEAAPLLPTVACDSTTRRSGGGFWRRCELWVRSIRVFWTAFRLFLDYKILQWRTNQMSEAQGDEVDRMWDAVSQNVGGGVCACV